MIRTSQSTVKGVKENKGMFKLPTCVYNIVVYCYYCCILLTLNFSSMYSNL